jgi:hypothetical protein
MEGLAHFDTLLLVGVRLSCNKKRLAVAIQNAAGGKLLHDNAPLQLTIENSRIVLPQHKVDCMCWP